MQKTVRLLIELTSSQLKTQVQVVHPEGNYPAQVYDLGAPGFEKDWFYMFLHHFRPLLEGVGSFEKIEIQQSPNIDALPEVKSALEEAIQVVLSTNQVLRDYESLKGLGRLHENILFYSLEHQGIRDLYERSHLQAPERVFFESAESKMNPLKRDFDMPMYFKPLGDFIVDLFEKRIRTVVGLNMYMTSHYRLEAGIHLPTILEFLGVEFISFDIDIYDWVGYRHKIGQHSNQSRRFSCWPHVQKFWDQTYGLKVSHYPPPVFCDDKSYQPVALAKKPTPVVLSHSRINEFLRFESSVLSVLESCREDSLILDFQRWYYAARHYCLYDLGVRGAELEYINSYLYHIYIHGTTFLKYLVLDELRLAGQKCQVFGDEGWSKLFPEFYQNAYLQDQDLNTHFKDESFVQILMNTSYSYLEANPALHKSMNANRAFLAFPPVVKNEAMSALAAIEYRNPKDLVNKLEQVSETWKNPELLNSLTQIKRQLSSSADQIVEDLLSPTLSVSSSAYDQTQLELESRFKTETESFLKQQRDSLHQQIERIFKKVETNARLENSRWKDRGFVKKLIELRN